MENQTDIESQGTQPADQSLEVQPNPIPPKPGINYWKISTLILGALFLVMLGVNVSGITPPPPEPPTPPVSSNTSSFTGTVKTGAQLGEVKSYCAEGLYLVADEGKELVDGIGTKMLLLRLPGESDEPVMLSDQQYVGRKVEVIGKYPAAEVFCEALICSCEDYILVESINNIQRIRIEGRVDCLPHRDKTGPQTLECAFGIQSKDNKYYGLEYDPLRLLSDNPRVVFSDIIIPGQKVVITGVLTLDQDSQYDRIGTIEVVSIEYVDE